MRASLGSNLSLEAKAGLISPIHTPSTNPLALPLHPHSPPQPHSWAIVEFRELAKLPLSWCITIPLSEVRLAQLESPQAGLSASYVHVQLLLSLCTSLGPLSFALVGQGLCPAWPCCAQAPWTVAN